VPLWLYHQEGIRPNGDAEASVSCASLLGFVALLRTLLLVKHATNTLYAMPWDLCCSGNDEIESKNITALKMSSPPS
jgi:hypothetical protein